MQHNQQTIRANEYYTAVLRDVERHAEENNQQAIHHILHTINADNTRSSSLHSTTLIQAIHSYLASFAGNHVEAIAYLEEGLSGYTELGLDWNHTLLTIRLAEVYYRLSSFKQAMPLLEAAHAKSVQIGNRVLQARVAETMGLLLLRLGRIDESQERFNHALGVQHELKDERAILKLKSNLGSLHVHRGEAEKALQYYLEALHGFEQRNAQHTVASVATNVGICYADLANYPESLRYLHRAIEVAEQIGATSCMEAATGALGEVYEACEDFDKALHWLEESLKHALAGGNVRSVCLKRLVIGTALIHLGRIDEAAHQLETAHAMATELDVKRESALASAHLAWVRVRQHRLDEASELIESALGVLQQPGYDRDVVPALLIDARIRMETKEIDRCMQQVQRVITMTPSMGMEKEHADALQLCYRIERERNNVESALSSLEQYLQIHKHILGEQRQRHLSILETERSISEQAKEHQHAIAHERKLREQQRALLTNMLPEVIAERLMAGETNVADSFEEVSILFLDLVNFTGLASRIPPEHVLFMLNNIFGACDVVVRKYGLTKIKTIGDSYMAVAGAPIAQADNVERMARAALELSTLMTKLVIKLPDGVADTSWASRVGELEVRMGIHCGPVSAGIIGAERMAYDVWGDTVNIAARMEQSGMPGLIHVTEHFQQRLTSCNPSIASFRKRGLIDVKGKGRMETWWMYAQG